MTDLSTKNEWVLALLHERALKAENYEVCASIQREVNDRIKKNTINRSLMQGFKYFNPQSNKFEGEFKMDKLNGLFDKFIKKQKTCQ